MKSATTRSHAHVTCSCIRERMYALSDMLSWVVKTDHSRSVQAMQIRRSWDPIVLVSSVSSRAHTC